MFTMRPVSLVFAVDTLSFLSSTISSPPLSGSNPNPAVEPTMLVRSCSSDSGGSVPGRTSAWAVTHRIMAVIIDRCLSRQFDWSRRQIDPVLEVRRWAGLGVDHPNYWVLRNSWSRSWGPPGREVVRMGPSSGLGPVADNCRAEAGLVLDTSHNPGRPASSPDRQAHSLSEAPI